jgi:GNAT superfamily N-acetyltransferase
MTVTLRLATPDDARGVAVVHVRTWQEAYRGMVPDELLDALSIDERVKAYAKFRVLDDPERPLYVAEIDGDIVGFANVGPSREEQDTGELYAIYVRASHWDTGVGRALMVTGVDWLAQRYPDSTLWVLGSNDRARRFYERGGWRVDGTTKDDDRGSFVLSEVRYRITHAKERDA